MWMTRTSLILDLLGLSKVDQCIYCIERMNHKQRIIFLAMLLSVLYALLWLIPKIGVMTLGAVSFVLARKLYVDGHRFFSGIQCMLAGWLLVVPLILL